MAAEIQPAPSFSRYRSVRKANQQKQHDPPPPPIPHMPPDQPAHDMDTVSRSMSRYRRQRPAIATAHAAHDQTAPPPIPGLIKRAGTQPIAPSTIQDNTSRARALSNPGGRKTSNPSKPPTSPDAQSPSEVARDEARRMLERDGERHARTTAQLKAEKRTQLDEAERLRAQQDAEEQMRLQQEKRAAEFRTRQDAARERALQARREEEEYDRAAERERPRTAKATRVPSAPSSPPSPETKRKFGFLRRRKGDESAQSSDNLGRLRQAEVSGDAPDLNGPPVTIKPGGGGVVPGIDAPISAVNAGDRRVLVECNRSRIYLPVTPTTTPMDLIRSAATCLSEPIDAKASVLLEAFGKVGVQRPLRKYEHVRDVLNSWDDDNQNSLVLVESPTGGNDHNLSASSVPAEKPKGISCCMHYSQKPGKWSKRWITLRNDGQIVMSKNESGKDASNICHLSDFDIYTPTARSAAEKVKPPKKVCFAIKSQQKSTMFMTTSSFVHFFCTNHKDDAAQFYSTVQGWRSWYLVHVMGEGQKKSKEPLEEPALDVGRTHKASGNQPTQALHRPTASVDSHYQLGSFKPLIDLTEFDQSSAPESRKILSPTEKDTAPKDTQDLYSRKMSMRTRANPPVAFPAHMAVETEPPLTKSSTNSSDDATFAAGGLLGRSYSIRQKAQRDRENKTNGPFTDGPSLLNNMDTNIPRQSIDDSRPQRMSSVRSTRGSGRASGEIKRSNTTRHGRDMPKPLVDLTPQYKEPPQFQKKGKGFHPEHIGPGGLIDSATSPDMAIAVPPSHDWRARNTSGSSRPVTSGGPSYERTKSLKGHGMKIHGIANNHSNVPESGDDAFTGRGLLAHAGHGPSGITNPHGHGVMDGSKANGPMLDVSERNQFAPGSLLANVAAQNPTMPIIDREKRRSFELPYGERY